MALECNHEVAVFQSAFKSVIQKYNCINSLEYNHRRSALEIIKRSYDDILKIRDDDGLSLLQKQHSDRKLFFGLLSSIYREKVEYWQPGECFEQFRDIYPPTSWPFILEIVKSFEWTDYLIECLDSTHPESLTAILKDILMHTLNPDDANIPILFRILTILIQKMLSFHCNAFSNQRILNFEDQINTISSFLAQQIANSSRWQPATLNKYYLHLFHCIFDTCDALLNTESDKETCTTSEIITTSNLARYEVEKTSVKPLITESAVDNLHWLIKFYQLCYDSLLMLDLNEMKQLALESGGELAAKNGLLLDLKVYLSALNSKSIVCDANRKMEIVSLLQLIHQRMELLFDSIADVGPKIRPNVMDKIDQRGRHYEKYLDQLIGNSSLLKQIDYLECLRRNSSLIDRIRAMDLINWLINEKDKPDFFIEYIQQTILCAFSTWPVLVRQHFQQECLIEYEEKNILVLMSDHFQEELTATFNKFVCDDPRAINNLSVQMGRLCLQSSRKTIAMTVFRAKHSTTKEQGDALALLLKSVFCSNSKVISIASKITCDVLNEVLLNDGLTELEFQRLKIFIRKLLRCKQSELPLINYSDFLRVCVLPYLDQWNPGRGSTVTLFALQLFHIILNTDCFLKSGQWTCEFKPSVLLCYLALIIGQCKVVRRNCAVDYMQIKMQAVTTLNKLNYLVGQNLASVQKNEILWLWNKLETVDEFLVFYFINLFDYFGVDLATRKCDDPFRVLLEFSCCSDDNLKSSLELFENLVRNVGENAENNLINALAKVLPYFIFDEWKRVSIILEHVFQTLYTNFLANWKPCVTLTSKNSHNICCTSSILLHSIYIYLRNNSGFNVHFMMQCYRSIIKEKLDSFDDPELTSVAAELFFQVYHLMRFFTSEAIEEGFVLLMELSQIYMKDTNLQHVKKMKRVVADMKMTTYQSSLLKVLTQTS